MNNQSIMSTLFDRDNRGLIGMLVVVFLMVITFR
jgi:hypothetical protein